MSGRMLGKGMLRELPLWGLENPLSAGEAVPRECSPSDALFFSGSSGGCIWGVCDQFWVSAEVNGSLLTAMLGQFVPLHWTESSCSSKV